MIGPRSDYINERYHTTPFEAAVKRVQENNDAIVHVQRAWRPRAAFEAGMTVWRRLGIDWFAPVANLHGTIGEHGQVIRIDRGEQRTPITVHPLKQHRETLPRGQWDPLPCGGSEDMIVTETGDVFVGLFWRGNYKDMANETGDILARMVANANN